MPPALRLLAPGRKNGSGDDEPAGLPLDEGGEGGVNPAFGAGLQDKEMHPFVCAASCTASTMCLVVGLFKFTSRAITLPEEPARKAAQTAWD